MPGAFVVFEGGDGAGKSTQCRLLADALRERGHEVLLTREPGGTTIGEAIREVLLGVGSHGMVARTEALLFAAARAQHSAELIRPALARGAMVLSDRYLDSSVAYQGAARGLGVEVVRDLNAVAVAGCVPDRTVLLRLDADLAGARGDGRGDYGDDRFEREGESFQATIAAAFDELAASEPDRFLVVDATGTPEQVHDRVLAGLGVE